MHIHIPVSALALVISFSVVAQGQPLSRLLHSRHQPRSSTLSVDQILAIAPKSVTCEGAPIPVQCRTAEQALPHIAASFQKYGITSAGEQAALLGIMAFETGDFKYNVNVVPGTPGQGTRNMQSPVMNRIYALSTPALSAKLAPVTDNPTAVLDLLTADDDLDFGSAAWFLKTQCGPAVSQNLASGNLAEWQSYITGCVGTTPTQDRQAYYERALAALGAA